MLRWQGLYFCVHLVAFGILLQEEEGVCWVVLFLRLLPFCFQVCLCLDLQCERVVCAFCFFLNLGYMCVCFFLEFVSADLTH